MLVEPYWSPVASVLYKRLFASESFDKTAPSWDNKASAAMPDANQALSYVVSSAIGAIRSPVPISAHIFNRRIRVITCGIYCRAGLTFDN
ncbi:MAG: methyltransferase [Bradyrhizobium sp.]|nr:methyltransferase [Bradyrhizobium sp.]